MRPQLSASQIEFPDGRPLRVYGSEVSYFTGKLESYLRYKGIPYELHPSTNRYFSRILRERTGATQIPAVELPDGRWMTDTTPMIAWLETQHPEPRVIPADPLQAFVCRVLEDYADEWLWRPAMHYRWSYREDRTLLGQQLARELMTDVPAPRRIKHLLIRRRQLRRFVLADGVDSRTRPHVEAGYLNALDFLEAIFQSRPFLLGQVPTLADVGFMGPMFRHFGHDPTPVRIMQQRAPAVWEWLGRMWNARASRTRGELCQGIPDDLGPILKEIGATHLEHLSANAEAWQLKRKHFDVGIQGVRYRRLPTSQYRVWCLEQLRAHLDALPADVRGHARTLLDKHGCWEPLLRVREIRSRHDPGNEAPFSRGLRVYPL